MNPTGKILCDLAPNETNMRNSEGAFVTLNDGRLLFAYSRYGGKGFRDESSADIAAILSVDDGETWSEPQVLFTAESHGTANIMSVSMQRLTSGDIGIFYLIKHGFHDTRLVMRRSKDEGKSWSKAEYCINRLGFNVVNNDRVIKLSNGNLIFPAAHHGVRIQPGNPSFPYAANYFYCSDDDGRSWVENDCSISLNSPHTKVGLQEPGIIEIAEGVLWCWARTDMGRQYEYFSFDNGLTWGEPRPSRFTSPCSPLSMKRIPGTQKLLAVWNPISNYTTIKKDIPGSDRKRLVYAVSPDNSGTWGEPVILEDDSESGFCYTAIHFLENSVLLGYCAGNREKEYSILSKLRIRKIEISELL